jgi:hypothetical protein
MRVGVGLEHSYMQPLAVAGAQEMEVMRLMLEALLLIVVAAGVVLEELGLLMLEGVVVLAWSLLATKTLHNVERVGRSLVIHQAVLLGGFTHSQLAVLTRLNYVP